MANSDWCVLDDCVEPVLLRLFCLPYAGGGASIFRGWKNNIPRGVQLCRIQFPGRENRICDQAIDNPEKLVDDIVDNIFFLLDRPFAIFGQSMGGLLAHRLAYCLQMKNKVAKEIFISAARPPHREHPSIIHNLPDREFIDDLMKRQRTSKEVLENKDLMDILLPMLRADFKIAETYKINELQKLNSNISVLIGEDDQQLNSELASAWRDLAGKDFDFNVFQGAHFFVQTHPDPVYKYVNNKLQSHIMYPDFV